MAIPAARGHGIGEQVVTFLLGHARLHGATRAWILTTDATEFFRKIGFTEADRAEAPEAIRATTEFASLCPASAACMWLGLPASA